LHQLTFTHPDVGALRRNVRNCADLPGAAFTPPGRSAQFRTKYIRSFETAQLLPRLVHRGIFAEIYDMVSGTRFVKSLWDNLHQWLEDL
jgi:hypothetical protein